MKTSTEFQKSSAAEIQREIEAATRALFEAGFHVSQGAEKRTHLARQLRKKIAVLKTLQTQQSKKPTTPSA